METRVDRWLTRRPRWLQAAVLLALLFGPALGVALTEAAFAAAGR